MVDLRFLGKEGLIIEYTDIVSLVGYNIIKYLKSNNINNDVVQRMSDEDILSAYVNRETFDISKWIKTTFDIDCNIDDYNDSILAFKPNNVYAYKMFTQASKEKMHNLYIYSEKYSKIIEGYTEAFNIPELKYVYGDIIPILNKQPNSTLTTSNPETLKRCVDVTAPTLITIVDDFMYVSEIIKSKIHDKMRGTNKIVMFTSISDNGI